MLEKILNRWIAAICIGCLAVTAAFYGCAKDNGPDEDGDPEFILPPDDYEDDDFDERTQICVEAGSGTGNGSAASPYRTIQAAIDAASNGDVIKVAKGTYSETLQIEQKKVYLIGGYAGKGDFNTASPQENVTVINGTKDDPCIYVYIDQSISGWLIIRGFSIRNGQRGIELSGGWSANLTNIRIESNLIENNGSPETERGGGIGLEGVNVSVRNNVIRNNKAGRGAAIGATDDLRNFLLSGNRIENNTGYDDHAGGVSINGTGTITRNVFDGNVAAASHDYGWGGGLLIFGDDDTRTTVALSYNVYRNNRAPSRGGAVFVDDGANVKMEHELIYNNETGESGSAIYVDADWNDKPSFLEMNNCTVSGNSTKGGDAALFVQGSTVSVQNCIFWNNGKDFEMIDDGKLTVTYTLTQQGYTGTGNITSNPLFVDASKGNFHLQAGSPAIDAGNPASDYSKEPAPNGGRVNMGCYGNTDEATGSR